MFIVLIVCAFLIFLPIVWVQLERAASTSASISPFYDSSESSSNTSGSLTPLSPPPKFDGSQETNGNVQARENEIALSLQRLAGQVLPLQPESLYASSTVDPQYSVRPSFQKVEGGGIQKAKVDDVAGITDDEHCKPANMELPHLDGNQDTDSESSITTARRQPTATPTQRKPWDPPFPTSTAGTRKSAWRSLPAVDAISGSPRRLEIRKGSQDGEYDEAAESGIHNENARRSEEEEHGNEEDDLQPLSPGPPRPFDSPSREAPVTSQSPAAPSPKVGSSLYFHKEQGPEPRNSSVQAQKDVGSTGHPQLSSQASVALQQVASRLTPTRPEPRIPLPQVKGPVHFPTIPLSSQHPDHPPPPPPQPTPSISYPNDGDPSTSRSPTPRPPPPNSHSTGHLSSSPASILKSIALILACLISIFLFAVLIAHCLAWFIVYKTEARLGEARSGLLRGGEMRMCLCAR
ncbi:hypothetical protein K491DRAFT_284088 [Lophiostoma macrostomum CBS 122681]|uniref:Uncharacterized protein n=1 Tax=Lophiostoma macrostomum CBS 122681 TaxID=1314788 RepID=A0A6A6TTJ7_9PLEO|nr:hypothetical protein K491DRAFT_284088 [Lophiostoma macrostomum CBS 122681]